MKVALICGTAHDHQTSYCHDSIHRAAEALENHCKPLLFPRFDSQYDALLPEIEKQTDNGVEIVIAYISAHGDRHQRGMIDGRGTLFFDGQVVCHLRKSILVLCSCLRDAAFVNEIISRSENVIAVFGYSPDLSVPICTSKPTHQRMLESYKRRFFECLVQPLTTLSGFPSCSDWPSQLNAAMADTKKVWAKLATDYRFNETLRSIADSNYENFGLHASSPVS